MSPKWDDILPMPVAKPFDEVALCDRLEQAETRLAAAVPPPKRCRRRPFFLALLLLSTAVALVVPFTCGEKPDVPRAKPRAAATADRPSAPVITTNKRKQYEFVQLWRSVAEEVGPPPRPDAVPVPASIINGVRLKPKWE